MNEAIAKVTSKIEECEIAELGLNFTPFQDRGEDPHMWLRSFTTCADFKGYDVVRKLAAFKNVVEGYSSHLV